MKTERTFVHGTRRRKSGECMRQARRSLRAITGTAALALLVACVSGCALPESGQSEAIRSFKKEVTDARNVLAPALTDTIANGSPREAASILEKQCALASKEGRPFACGITVLDHLGITLASATLGDPTRRLNYSRYEVVMKALKGKKVVKTRLFLQDRTTLYIVGIPLVRDGDALGLLVLAFDASDLRNRFHLTEEEFLKMELNR